MNIDKLDWGVKMEINITNLMCSVDCAVGCGVTATARILWGPRPMNLAADMASWSPSHYPFP
jgi:hypothetical protein